MITASQLLLSLIILFIIARTFLAYKKKNLSPAFSFIWIVFWAGVLILIFQQNIVSNLARKVGISRGVDLIIYLSLIAAFYMIYKILVLIEEINKKLTQLVRKLALKEIK